MFTPTLRCECAQPGLIDTIWEWSIRRYTIHKEALISKISEIPIKLHFSRTMHDFVCRLLFELLIVKETFCENCSYLGTFSVFRILWGKCALRGAYKGCKNSNFENYYFCGMGKSENMIADQNVEFDKKLFLLWIFSCHFSPWTWSVKHRPVWTQQTIYQDFPICSPLGNSMRLAEKPKSNKSNVICWIHEIKCFEHFKSWHFDTIFKTSGSFFALSFLHCGRDYYGWLLTCGPDRRLNWQYMARSWFKLESPAIL